VHAFLGATRSSDPVGKLTSSRNSARTIYIVSSQTHFARLAGRLGFEPRLAESESAVLPLDDLPKRFSRLKRIKNRVFLDEKPCFKKTKF
jgi:hypothetical protein